jgi:hypothetical protein
LERPSPSWYPYAFASWPDLEVRSPVEHLVDFGDKDLPARTERVVVGVRSDVDTEPLSVQEHANALLEILQEHRETDELKFSFPFIAEVLPLCRIVISGCEIEIAPTCPPTELVNPFRKAKRRIYMTATLSDDGI